MTTNPTAHHRYLADDDDHEAYAPVGVDGLLAATEKLLAVNRGLAEPDDRDSLPNDRIYTVDRLMAERVKLDHGRTLRSMMGRLSRAKTLKPLGPDAFSEYSVGYIKSNPLVPALEEINLMHNLEQKRRITKMGPGGIGDPNAITDSMQAVSATQFGFVDPIAGPECLVGDHEVYTRRGWVRWDQVTDDEVFACKVDGGLVWSKADRVVREHYAGDLIVAENATLRMAVTPTHRVVHKRDYYTRDLRVATAEEVEGASIWLPARHEPEPGDSSITHFELPDVTPLSKYSSMRNYGPFEIGDWCEFMGWWLSEGSLFTGERKNGHRTQRVEITQCPEANPDNRRKISELFRRMRLPGANGNGASFVVTGLQFVDYFRWWTQGCLDKHIPEELFAAPLHARQRMFDALIRGDGTHTSKCLKYCSVSRRLAESVERLAFTLGFSAYTKQVGITSSGRPYFNARVIRHENRTVTKAHWSRQPHDGLVYCATVPGGQLHVRGKPGTSGYWTGNSEKAGIDVRLAHGARIGSDGRIYQLARNRRTGKNQWVSPSDLRGKTLKLPD